MEKVIKIHSKHEELIENYLSESLMEHNQLHRNRWFFDAIKELRREVKQFREEQSKNPLFAKIGIDEKVTED